MVDADTDETGVRQLAFRCPVESKTILGVRQRRLVDLPLVAFHPRNVGIAEQGDAVGGETNRLIDCPDNAIRRLTGKAIHEIETRRADPGRA